MPHRRYNQIFENVFVSPGHGDILVTMQVARDFSGQVTRIEDTRKLIVSIDRIRFVEGRPQPLDFEVNTFARHSRCSISSLLLVPTPPSHTTDLQTSYRYIPPFDFARRARTRARITFHKYTRRDPLRFSELGKGS